MIIKDKIPFKSLPATMQTVADIYPDEDKNEEDSLLLTSIIQALSYSADVYHGNYTCYIEQSALDCFLDHANDIYDKYNNEATGLFLGYYLHCPDDESKKIAVAVHFFPARSGTSVTCEITHEETARIVAFCKRHKVVPLVWPHTHPFNRPLFYSSVDSATLACTYSAPHQMGVVCDNLRNAFMGFKIIDGKECNESIYSFDLEKSLTDGTFSSACLYKKPSTVVFGEKRKHDKPSLDEKQQEENSLERQENTEVEQNVKAEAIAPSDPEQSDFKQLCLALEQQTAQIKKMRRLLLLFLVLDTSLLALIAVYFMLQNGALKILSEFF